MTKEEDFKLLKIQTCVLRVNIHCDGCRQKVKKLLQRIEGVFQVVIDAENQRVSVSGSVDPATLIKRLVRAGKHAEIWSQKANQNQKQKNNSAKDDKLVNKGPKQPQQKLPTFNCEEDIDGCFDEEEGEDYDDEEFQLFKEKAAHLGLLRQRAIEANNAKKGVGIGQIPGPAANNGKMNNNKSGNGKKVDPNQQMVMKNSPSGIDPKAMAPAMRMNNAHSLGSGGGSGGGGNINIGEEARRGNNDLSSMMNMAGFNGNLMNFATPSSLGINSNPQGGFQLQQNNGYQPSSSPAAYPMATQYQPSSANGFNHHHQSPLMNMLTRQAMNQQPQMMYNRTPMIPPSTGYYYNYCPSPVQSTYPYADPYYYKGQSSNSAVDIFSDENTSSCSIM